MVFTRFFCWLTLNCEPVTFSLALVLNRLLLINRDNTTIHLGDMKVTNRRTDTQTHMHTDNKTA